MSYRSRENALIGHTGFVGSNLARQRPFDAFFNSKNVHDLAGRHFRLLVCAGVSAIKWQANQDPEADWAGIQRLVTALQKTTADRFVLISTVDVYPEPGEPKDESFDCLAHGNHAYGHNRARLERIVTDLFANVHIVRLPALFGPGLKKNAIYDLMSDNCLHAVNPAGQFQWYDIDCLSGDIDTVVGHRLPVANLVPEPLPLRRLIDARFAEKDIGSEASPAGRYDILTCHSDIFGSPATGYMMGADESYDRLLYYVDRVKGPRSFHSDNLPKDLKQAIWEAQMTRALRASRMDPRHGHLDALLDDDTAGAG